MKQPARLRPGKYGFSNGWKHVSAIEDGLQVSVRSWLFVANVVCDHILHDFGAALCGALTDLASFQSQFL